jgi:hypothetical protein
MLAAPVAMAEREPRRARYLIPRDLPSRGKVIAALTVLAIVGHLLFAQLTLLLAALFQVTSRLSRWRPQWLAAPATVGLIWVLAIGPATALAGFTAAPRKVAGYLAKTAAAPANILHLSAGLAGLGHALPRQFPLALIAAAAEAAAAAWLRWLHTAEQDIRPARPGLLALSGRQFRRASVKNGGVVTREGACLGIVDRTGQRVAVSWPEAERGMLCTGSAAPAVAATSFQVVHAAIRRRKPVIVVDLAGTPGLAEALAKVCAAAEAPLRVFGPSGPACYEPLRGGDPARQAALLMGMIDWGEIADHARRTCGGYLTDLFAVAAAAPADPAVPVLDDVVHLLSPAALRARAQCVPTYHPRREPLAERVSVSASLLRADPAPAALLAEQLTGLRASSLGQWLCPEPSRGRAVSSAQISLSGVVRDRAVALFLLDQAAHGRPAAMIANLVALDTAAVYAQAHRDEVAGDGLAWFSQCEAADPAALASLIGAGRHAGLAALLGTVAPQAAERIASQVNVLVIHRLDSLRLAAALTSAAGAAPGSAEPSAAATGPPAPLAIPGMLGVPAAALPAAQAAPSAGPDPWTAGPVSGAGPAVAGAPAMSPATLCGLGQDEFALAVKGPVRRAVPTARFICGGPR